MRVLQSKSLTSYCNKKSRQKIQKKQKKKKWLPHFELFQIKHLMFLSRCHVKIIFLACSIMCHIFSVFIFLFFFIIIIFYYFICFILQKTLWSKANFVQPKIFHNSRVFEFYFFFILFELFLFLLCKLKREFTFVRVYDVYWHNTNWIK